MAGVNFDMSYLPARNCSASQERGNALAYCSESPKHFAKPGIVVGAVHGGVNIIGGGGLVMGPG